MDVNSSNYQVLCQRTEAMDLVEVQRRLIEPESIRLLHAAMGINTESGEVTDVMKKFIFYNRPQDREHLIEELGDLLWYVALACNVIDIPMAQVMRQNIEKLKVRYPETFTEELANRRLDKDEEEWPEDTGPDKYNDDEGGDDHQQEHKEILDQMP